MKAVSFALVLMVMALLMIIATPGAFALEEETLIENPVDGDGPGTSMAIGKVYVTLVEWEPDIEGLGAGMFTATEFDFSEFFNELYESLASLFN